jgi:hypothetical protein
MEVNADSNLSILLFHRNNVSKPSWVLNLLDEACRDELVHLGDDLIFELGL